MSEPTVYDRLGGEEGVRRLVQRFYVLMDELPDARGVRDMHPTPLARSEDSLFKFLSGWFGGPPLYMQERGHPRLRMRHMPFVIGPAQRDHWLVHMRHAVETCAPTPDVAEMLMNYFVPAAEQMRNDTGLPITSSTYPR